MIVVLVPLFVQVVDVSKNTQGHTHNPSLHLNTHILFLLITLSMEKLF